MASFTKEVVNPWLAKRPLVFNGRLANRGLASLASKRGHRVRLNMNISSYLYKGTPIIKIRRSHDLLIFIMEIPIPGKTVFILRRGPGFQCPAQWSVTETCGSPLGIWYTATERATCRRHRAAWITGTTHIGTYVSDVRNSLEINKSMVSRPRHVSLPQFLKLKDIHDMQYDYWEPFCTSP